MIPDCPSIDWGAKALDIKRKDNVLRVAMLNNIRQL